MKQHITIEQLRELNSDQEMKLMEWYRPKYVEFVRGDPDYQCYRLTGHEYGQDGFCKVCFNPSHEKKYSSSTPALLSIGQMIEFLDSKLLQIELPAISWPGFDDDDHYNSTDTDWCVTIIDHDHIYGRELCDALWESVKVVLCKK